MARGNDFPPRPVDEQSCNFTIGLQGVSFLGIIAVLHLAVTVPTKKFVLLLLLAACKGLHMCGRFSFKDSTFVVCNQLVVVALFEAPGLAFSLYILHPSTSSIITCVECQQYF